MQENLGDFLSHSFLLLALIFSFLQYVEIKWLERIRRTGERLKHAEDELEQYRSAHLSDPGAKNWGENSEYIAESQIADCRRQIVDLERRVHSIVMPRLFLAIVGITVFLFGLRAFVAACLSAMGGDLPYDALFIFRIQADGQALSAVNVSLGHAIYGLIILADVVIPLLFAWRAIAFVRQKNERLELEQRVGDDILRVIAFLREGTPQRMGKHPTQNGG